MRLFRNSLALFLLLVPPWVLQAAEESLPEWFSENCHGCVTKAANKTGVYILEKGEESLLGRAWLTQNATRTIDVQYFIWSSDNIGTLAAEQLLSAAERGVRVRVLVDDTLIDARDETLLLLSAHKNSQIRIYNPNLRVGVNFWQRMGNAFTKFRAVNQRMHDKTAIFDGIAGITGGRNMADEYFDYDHEYNFRDRDVLLLGPAVAEMSENFEEFWNSEFSHPVEDLLKDIGRKLTKIDVKEKSRTLHEYAANPRFFEPQVRQAIANAPARFPRIVESMSWENVTFISDVPGKNAGDKGLGGGGESTTLLINLVRNAKSSVLIQSPYLVMPEGGIELFGELVDRGVRIRISTNSLASTDNIQAFSGYFGQRKALLKAGVELYEFNPNPAIQSDLVDRYPRLAERNPVFAIHAKSMVIDDKTVYIGTFNLDPRSANLNTEVGMLTDSAELARQLTESIERDIAPSNSWQTTLDFNPDSAVGVTKRLRLWLNSALPLEPVL